jgi:shikimate kinase / 3-dehydroquinate synthase
LAPVERALVLIGFMGAGKTTAAGELSVRLDLDMLDSDELLEERFGHSIAEEFERNGEAAFRAQEEELVCELLERAGSSTVVALGGGSVLSTRVRAALERHVTVLLDVDPHEAWQRASGGARPLASDLDSFVLLYEQRQPLYEELADVFLPPDRRRITDLTDALLDRPGSQTAPAIHALSGLRAMTASPPGTRMLWATAESGDYPVFVGTGLLESDRLAAVWPLDRAASRPFCVTDRTVEPLYTKRLGQLAHQIAIPPGESAKTLATAELVWSELTRAGMTRADHLVALGGGVVGDLAGFCAATYQRGVPVVQVPTTLVAQVDSAYGGKTGVDLPEAKNYVGAYHQPAAVLVDPETLRTLPSAELSAGWVEVLKTALIAGGELWERVSAEVPESLSGPRSALPSALPSGLASWAPPDERTILACARLKLAVVAEDERDGGRRQVLNLGHTVGHAIETATAYGRYRHGEAVGLGLLAALRLSGQEGLRAQVRELLSARGLPVALEGVGVDEVVAAVAHDKKRLGTTSTPFVLVHAPGDVRVGCEVAPEDLRAAVAELAS